MNDKGKEVKICHEMTLPTIEYEVLKHCLSRDKMTLEQFFEKKVRELVHDAMSKERTMELPGYIHTMMIQKKDFEIRRENMRRMARYIQGHPYDVQRKKIRFCRHNVSHVLVFLPYNKNLSDDMKMIPGARWNREAGAWQIHIDELDRARECIYKNLGIRTDLYDYDHEWLRQRYDLTEDNVREVLISIQDGA